MRVGGNVERGLKPDVVVSTSIGTVDEAMIVSDPTAVEIEREWRALTTDQIHRLRLNPLEYLERPSLLDTRPWAETLGRQISFHKVRTSPIAFRIIATNVKRGKLTVFQNRLYRK